MSIVELLKSVDQLAKAVTSKNKELDQLKENYNAKIEQMNHYLSKIQQLALPQTSNDSEINDEEFLDMVNSSQCSNCNLKLDTEEYIVIPRAQLKQLISNDSQLKDDLANLKLDNTINEEERHSASIPTAHKSKQSIYTPPVKERGNTKKICSYCKKQGHTRAKCLTRLSTPLK